MLVIFDDKNRTSGVREYLIDGEKATSSKYMENKSGLSNYLNFGKTGDRDVKDKRIPLHGDLDVLDEVIKVGTAKGASESYRNFVVSFQEDNISTPHLKEVVESFLDTYMVGYQKDEYTAYAEAHLPKIKYKTDKNGTKVRRHLHMHVSLAKYSAKLDRQLDMGHNGEFVKTGGRKIEVEHWKKLIEQRYNLKPTLTKPISTSNTYKNKTLQQTREGLNSFCKNKAQSLNSLDELIDELKQFDFISSIKKSVKAKTPYISVQLERGKSIRLKGTLFSNKSFNLAKEELQKKAINHFYSESKEPIEVQVPGEFIRLQEARASKINKELAKKRSEYIDPLTELIPMEFDDNYKEWIGKREYKNDVVSPLTYRVNDIKSKEKNNIDLKTYNQRLDPRLLLQFLRETHNINEEIYHGFVNKNNEFRIEVGTRNYNVTDFLLKEMNFDWEEVTKYLSYVHKKQQELQNNDSFVEVSQVNIYQRISFQNKLFIDIYKTNSKIDLSKFHISKNHETTTLRNKDIQIEDTGDTLKTLRNSQDIELKVNLMLEIAIAKGWSLDSIDIDGTKEFKQEVANQINILKKEQEHKENISTENEVTKTQIRKNR